LTPRLRSATHRYAFGHDTQLSHAPHSVTHLQSAMKSYFDVTDRMGMLPHLYSKFDKTKYSGFARQVAEGRPRPLLPLL